MSNHPLVRLQLEKIFSLIATATSDDFTNVVTEQEYNAAKNKLARRQAIADFLTNYTDECLGATDLQLEMRKEVCNQIITRSDRLYTKKYEVRDEYFETETYHLSACNKVMDQSLGAMNEIIENMLLFDDFIVEQQAHPVIEMETLPYHQHLLDRYNEITKEVTFSPEKIKFRAPSLQGF
jgi:hypothetical protein